MALTWMCHICGEERPDCFISVSVNQSKSLLGGVENVRYCNDNPDCADKAKTFSFFVNKEKA